MTRTYLLREGDPPPDGVGALRRFAFGPGGSQEEVVAWDPPRHLGYVAVRGLPVRHYRADVHLDDDGTGTVVTWRCSARTPRPRHRRSPAPRAQAHGERVRNSAVPLRRPEGPRSDLTPLFVASLLRRVLATQRPGYAGSSGSRTITTGQLACAAQYSLTDPRSMPAKAP